MFWYTFYTSFYKLLTKSIVLDFLVLWDNIYIMNINCGVEKTMKIIGKKWSVLILRDFFDGKKDSLNFFYL